MMLLNVSMVKPNRHTSRFVSETRTPSPPMCPAILANSIAIVWGRPIDRFKLSALQEQRRLGVEDPPPHATSALGPKIVYYTMQC